MIPAPPPHVRAVDFGRGRHFPTYGNTTWLSDCVVAAAADLEQLRGVRPSYRAVVADYWTMSPTNGGVPLAKLFARWSSTGIAGETIAAPVPVSGTRAQIESAIRRDHGLYGAMVVRPGAFGTFAISVGGAPPISVPHAVAVVGYSSAGLRVVSWGRELTVSWAYWTRNALGLWAIS